MLNYMWPPKGTIAHLRDTALHNQKIGVIDIELHTLKQELNLLLGRFVSIQDVFRYVG